MTFRRRLAHLAVYVSRLRSRFRRWWWLRRGEKGRALRELMRPAPLSQGDATVAAINDHLAGLDAFLASLKPTWRSRLFDWRFRMAMKRQRRADRRRILSHSAGPFPMSVYRPDAEKLRAVMFNCAMRELQADARLSVDHLRESLGSTKERIALSKALQSERLRAQEGAP